MYNPRAGRRGGVRCSSIMGFNVLLLFGEGGVAPKGKEGKPWPLAKVYEGDSIGLALV